MLDSKTLEPIPSIRMVSEKTICLLMFFVMEMVLNLFSNDQLGYLSVILGTTIVQMDGPGTLVIPDTCNTANCFSWNITYPQTTSQIQSLIASSKSCKQLIRVREKIICVTEINILHEIISFSLTVFLPLWKKLDFG